MSNKRGLWIWEKSFRSLVWGFSPVVMLTAQLSADLAAVFTAFAVTYKIASMPQILPFGPSPLFEQVIITIAVVSVGSYRQQCFSLLAMEIARVLQVILALFFATVVFSLFFAPSAVAIRAVIIFFPFLFLFVSTGRVLLDIGARRLAKKWPARVQALIYGDEIGGRLLAQRFFDSPWLGVRPLVCLSESSTGAFRSHVVGNPVPVLPGVDPAKNLPGLLQRFQANLLFVVPPLQQKETLTKLIAACQTTGMSCKIVSFLPPPRVKGFLYHGIKRIVDFSLAVFFLTLLVPLLLLIALLVWLDSPGPIFFCQDRVGQHGRLFVLRKFRTMYIGSPVYAPSPADPSDNRLTRVGRWLRWTSLDELPQLYNVLRGEMSLVGPRPEMPFIVQSYTPAERERLRAKPGMTGLWQISSARGAPIHEHLEYDFCYLAQRSLCFDLAILFLTPFRMMGGV